jgi:DNA gyrase subunit A
VLDDYRTQKRGGRGKQAAATKEEDFIEMLFIANTHDTILCFTNRGRMFWLKVYEVPQGSRTARGKPIVNLLKMEDGERVNAILPVKEFDDCTTSSWPPPSARSRKPRCPNSPGRASAGIIAVSLDEGDHLIGVAITNGQNDVMLFSDEGKANRFDEPRCAPWAGAPAACAASSWAPAPRSSPCWSPRTKRRACSPPPKTATASAPRSATTPATAAAARA